MTEAAAAKVAEASAGIRVTGKPDELYVMTKIKKLLDYLNEAEKERVIAWVTAVYATH